jgi:hypothetical protein
LVAGQTQADVFKIVLPGPFNGNCVYGRHGIGWVDGSRFMIEAPCWLWGAFAVQPSGLVRCHGDAQQR